MKTKPFTSSLISFQEEKTDFPKEPTITITGMTEVTTEIMGTILTTPTEVGITEDNNMSSHELSEKISIDNNIKMMKKDHITRIERDQMMEIQNLDITTIVTETLEKTKEIPEEDLMTRILVLEDKEVVLKVNFIKEILKEAIDKTTTPNEIN